MIPYDAERPGIDTHRFDIWACPGCGTLYAELDGAVGDGCLNCDDVPEYYGELTSIVREVPA